MKKVTSEQQKANETKKSAGLVVKTALKAGATDDWEARV
jgi:hypothetical protein